jgi:CheY-like chemotaxis protein
MREKGGILDVSMSNVQFGPHDSARPQELPPGSYVRICVSDTGCGMDDKVMERIFEPYFTTKGVGEGTGMGLSVVHGIVRSHEGAITVVSQPGAGSTFCVFFPAGAKEVGTQPDAGPVGIPMGKESILFVDDEPELALLGKQALERFGYTVFSTAKAVEAFDVFRAAPDKFDLVVTDQTMPEMTGMELAAELRQIRPNIPVILCTGFSELVTEQNMRAAGIQEVVMKPLIMHEAGRIIRRVLDREGRK